MKTKIIDHQSLLLEKQRLQLVCANQEKEIAAKFNHLKEKLNPSLIIKESILEIIPREIRENKIVSTITSLISGNKTERQGITEDLFTLAKTTLLTTALRYFDKYLKKD